jgi:hypothetical protein
LQARIYYLIARGQLSEAGELLLLETGASKLPDWFIKLQNAFSAAGQRVGECERVASTIADGFRRVGENPQIVRVFSSPAGAGFLNWGGKQLVSMNNVHYAVMNGGRVFDAFTGAKGMTWAEYSSTMMSFGQLVYVVVP